MVNLAALLNTDAGQAKRPVPFNDGTYFGIIKSQEFTESKTKKTPGVQYNIELTHAADDTDLTGQDEEGNDVQLNPAGKVFRTTFWVSENSLFMLKDFIKSFGIEVEGRSFAELVPQVVGQPVMVDLTKSPRTSGEGFYNDIAKVVPAA